MTSTDLDADYTAFVEARWPSLVRAGVLLGCTIDEAHDLAQTTLLRCYTKWSQVQRADNPHSYVYRMLVNCHRDSRKRHLVGRAADRDAARVGRRRRHRRARHQ